MTDIKEFVRSKKPDLAEASITRYTTALKGLYNSMRPTDKENDLTLFNNVEEILEHLKDKKATLRTTILASLIAVTGDVRYKDKLQKDRAVITTQNALNIKSETQEANWVSGKEILDKLNELEKNAKCIYSKSKLSSDDLQDLQKYILLALMSGKYIEPRRSKDWTDFKIKNIDTDKDNYLLKSELILNSYKTAQHKGQQKIKIPIQLKNILTKWVGVNPTEYLFFSTSNKQLNSSQISHRFNDIFGGKVSTNILRHSYLTEHLGEDYFKSKEIMSNMVKVMNNMGSSVDVIDYYIKK